VTRPRLLLLLALAPLAACVGPTRADDPPPAPKDATIRVPANRLVRLTADAPDPKETVLWRVTPSAGVDAATTSEERFEFVAPPGLYVVERLTLRTSPTGKPTVFATQVYRVEVTGCDHVPPAPAPPDALPPARPKEPPKVDPPPAPKPKASPWEALGRIQFDRSGCTATVMWPRRADGRWDVLTAEHCVSAIPIGGRGQMQLRSGASRFAVKVVAKDARSDVAWLVTESADLGDLPFAVLAAENAPRGTRVWHGGFGVDNPGNREDGEVTRADTGAGKVEMILSVSSGDSGGGIFRADTGELISTVCCTVRRGAKVEMYGGHVESIRRLRPAPAKTDVADWWTPSEVPEVPAPDVRRDEARDWWTPCEVPVVVATAFGAIRPAR
jgi:hypothetical protein